MSLWNRWVNQCLGGHDTNRRSPNFKSQNPGQNCYYTASTGGYDTNAAKNAVDGWFNEVNDMKNTNSVDSFAGGVDSISNKVVSSNILCGNSTLKNGCCSPAGWSLHPGCLGCGNKGRLRNCSVQGWSLVYDQGLLQLRQGKHVEPANLQEAVNYWDLFTIPFFYIVPANKLQLQAKKILCVFNAFQGQCQSFI